ncbi:MAG: hypothetical protein KJO22_09965 [Bacteroidia bacterium]|nr:hypothetical protein [Bacteroidia bacterium]
MIKFFRKIRQKLLTENKFSKYLIYAIGEIVLVVIGILIALQINNWNENRKLNQTENKILTAIQQDLLKTLKDVEDDTHLNELSLKSAINIQRFLDEQLEFNDSLVLDFEIASFDYKLYDLQAGYKSLQSKGIETISNEELRNRIVFFYESSVPFLKRSENPPKLFNSLLFPYYQKNFMVNDNKNIKINFGHSHLDVKYADNTLAGFIPINEEFIKNDPEFRIIIREVIYNRRQVLSLYKRELTDLRNLVNDIDKK